MTEASSDARDLMLTALADEFAARRRAGEWPRLEDYCDRHPDLASDIRSLFPALVELEGARAAAGPDLAVATPDAPATTRLGDFHLLREVGRGGMGVVYEAEQVSLGRRVALKLLPPGVLRDPAKRLRFEREARAAAKLHHTNIVPVHGFGDHDGTPYYVMQFILGLGLDAVIEELGRQASGEPAQTGPAMSVVLAKSLIGEPAGPLTQTWVGPVAAALDRTMTHVGQPAAPPPSLPRADRGSAPSLAASGVALPGQSDEGSGNRKSTYWQSVARIGVQVAGALDHAHKQGVLHRDIKPANLLLDLTGTVWVADFGLAKADDSDDLTHTGDLLGTLRYMPPEAFAGKADARSDLYALGLTLFELVALRPAYDDRDRNTLFQRVTAGDVPRLRSLRPDAPRDLVTIIEKAIDREPARRYQTGTALADDLQRFLDGRPITARQATAMEQAWMWARRRPAVAGLTAALLLCLVAGTAISSALALRASDAADDAAAREREATLARDAAGKTRDAAARQAAGLLVDRAVEEARGPDAARALHLFALALKTLPPNDPEAAPLERVIRRNLTAWAETVPALAAVAPCGNCAVSPDGEVMATAYADATGGHVRCDRTATGGPLGPPATLPRGVAMMAFAADGRSVWAVVHAGNDAVAGVSIHRIDAATGRALQPPIPTAGPTTVVATPDGRSLFGVVQGIHPADTGPSANSFRERKWRCVAVAVWDAATGRLVRSYPVESDNEFARLAVSDDGQQVRVWTSPGRDRYVAVTLPAAGDGPPAPGRLPEGGVWDASLTVSPDLTAGLLVSPDRARRWTGTAASPDAAVPFTGVHDKTTPDGRAVVTRDEGRLFDLGAWPPRPSPARFAHPSWARPWGSGAGFSPDGRFLVTCIPSSGYLWRLPRPHSRPPLPPTAVRTPASPAAYGAAAVAPTATGAALWRGVADADIPPNLRYADVATGAVRTLATSLTAAGHAVTFSPDGRYLATGDDTGTARVWEAATGQPAGPPLRHPNWVRAVAFSSDGQTLAAGDYGPAGRIELWDWRRGERRRPPFVHDDIVRELAYTADGKHVVAFKTHDWSGRPEMIAWDVATGAAVARWPHPPSAPQYNPMAVRPDGKAVAGRDADGVLTLHALPSGDLLGRRPLDGTGVTRFTADSRLAAAADGRGVRLLDGGTLAPFPGGHLPHAATVRDMAFSPDGTLLVAGCADGAAQLWDVTTRKPLGPPAVLIGPILAVAFTPDGKACVAVAADGTVRRWPVPEPLAEPNLARLSDRLTLHTAVRMDDAQGVEYVSAAEWQTLRATLAADGTTALVPPRPAAEWHDGRAADAEQDRDAYGASWHLTRLAALRPHDWSVPARRGRLLASTGDRDGAAAAYDAAAKLAPSPAALAAWLRVAAADDAVLGRQEAARWGLDWAIALTPDDWLPFAARSAYTGAADEDKAMRLGADAAFAVTAADRAAAAGDWPRAAARVAALPAGVAVSYRQAVACLKAGDAAGYRAACVVLVETPPASVPEANAAAMAFALGPNATDDYAVPLAWIERALARLAEAEAATPGADRLRPTRHAFMNTRGAVLVRAGRFADGVKELREGMTFHPAGGEAHDWAFLALAEHALGRSDAAKEAAAKARAAAKPAEVWAAAEVALLLAEVNESVPP